MDRVQRAQSTLDNEVERHGKNHICPKPDESDRSVLLTIRIYPRKECFPSSESSSPRRGSDRTRHLDARYLTRDDRFIALEEHGSKFGVVLFVGEVRAKQGACIRVKEAHRAWRSALSAALAARPAPRVAPMAASRERTSPPEAGITRRSCLCNLAWTLACISLLATPDRSSAVTSALRERPSAFAWAFSLACRSSSTRAISWRIQA